MATMLIGYDLNRPGQNYDELFEVRSRAWAHGGNGLDSTWLVDTNLTSLEVANRLWAKMDKNDRLLVTRAYRSTTEWAGMARKTNVEWLIKHDARLGATKLACRSYASGVSLNIAGCRWIDSWIVIPV